MLAQVWNRFSPVAQVHATGLIYWRNHQAQVAQAQDVATAIQYQDQGIGGRRAATCIVFDRVFMNCLALHGIQCAEVELGPAQYATPLQPVPFFGAIQGFRGGPWNSYYYNPTGWAATTVAAHGNPGAPDGWQSHWITAVNTGAGNTGWQLYDPSYGLGPYDCNVPAGVNQVQVIPAVYDAAAVLHFSCIVWSDDWVNAVWPQRIDDLPSASPNPPHLTGTILDMN